MFGVLGNDPFGPALEEALRDKQVAGHPTTVRRLNSLVEAEACQVLFIALNDKKRVVEAIQFARRLHILTVSDSEGFVEAGGIIGLTMEDNKIRFEINAEAATRSGLQISSKLLRLAAGGIGSGKNGGQ